MATATVKDPKYINWIREGLGLLVVKRNLTPATLRILQDFHKKIGGVATHLPGAIPSATPSAAAAATGCSCTFKDINFGNKCMKKRCAICNPLVRPILAAHKYPTILKDNCDPSKWSTDPWEVAKAYMGPGQQKDNHGPEHTDCTNILLLWENCSYFHAHIKDVALLTKVREARNAGMHSPKMTLSDEEMKSAIAAMINLLQDATLTSEPDIDASGVSELEKVRDQKMSIIFPEAELNVWLDQIKSLNNSWEQLKRENEPVATFLHKNPDLLEEISKKWPRLQSRVANVEKELVEVIQKQRKENAKLSDELRDTKTVVVGLQHVQLKMKMEMMAKERKEEVAALWGDAFHWTQEIFDRRMEIINQYQPIDGVVDRARILLVGPIGAGKSSFVNTIFSAIEGRQLCRAATAIHPNGVTKHFRLYRNHDRSGFMVTDTMGLDSDEQGFNLVDFEKATAGHLVQGYNFEKARSDQSDRWRSEPKLMHRVHVVVFVVDFSRMDCLDHSIMDPLKSMRQSAKARGIPVVLLLTHCDRAFRQFRGGENMIQKLFKDEAVIAAVERVGALTGVPADNIFPVVNNVIGIERDNISLLATYVFSVILRFADYYLITHIPVDEDD